MPATRRKQSNAMLYTLIIFVGLFIVATTVAVFYYVKAEEYRISRDDLQSNFNTFASESERGEVGSLVGTQKTPSTSYLRTMLDNLDEAVTLIGGGVPESTSAEVKINNAKSKVADTIKKSEEYVGSLDPNLTGLVQVSAKLTQKLQDTLDSKDQIQKNLDDTVADFKKTQEANLEAYMVLLKDKDNLMMDYNDVKAKYNDLSDYLKETTDERVQSLQAQLDQEKANLRTTTSQLTETQAKFSEMKGMLEDAKEELAEYTGKPKSDSMAYTPDGEILSVDNDSKIAYLNLGSNDHVYRGLTFAVYDRGAYIGAEGQDKAEIEIFDISDTYSAARITKSALNKPILKGDMAANLIWDKRKANEFVIAGDFDLNEDGSIDPDAVSKIKAIIEKWGGKVTDKITIDTDFLILGSQPKVLERPSLEDQERDPTALQRYQSTLDKLNQYNDLENRAASLWIPVFSYEKFIHLIGYQEKLGQAGTF